MIRLWDLQEWMNPWFIARQVFGADERTVGFKLHDHSPPVERLSTHLLNQHSVTFDDDTNLSDLVDTAYEHQTTLTAFFQLNQQRQQQECTDDLFYTDLPIRYVWKKNPQGDWVWSPRQRNRGTI